MRIHRTSWALSVLLAMTLGIAPPAWSQPRFSADTAQRADELFLQGKTLLRAGKKREAREAYLEAFRLKQSHDVAGNLGSVELALGMPRDAAEHLSFAIRHYAPTGTTQEQLDKVKQRLAEAKRLVATVVVSVNVAGAEVLVDGVSVGRAPLEAEVFVEPGTRTLSARLAGHEEAKQIVEAGKGKEHRVSLSLAPLAAAPPIPDAPRVAPPPQPPPVVTSGGPPRALLIVGGVLAAGGLAAGIGLTVAANGKGADRAGLLAKLGDSGCAHPGGANASGCADLLGAAKSQSALANGAVGAFVTGGVLALATAGIAVWTIAKPARARDSASIQLAPMLGVSERGVVVTGTW